jgi:hypothetical protein
VKKILLACAVLVFGVAEAAEVRCNIKNLEDAQSCMDKLAASLPEFEEPNDGIASRKIEVLVDLLKGLGRGKGEVEIAKASDFAGAVVVHGDEHHIVYFSLNKGRNVTPVELYDFNTVDFEYLIEKPLDGEGKLAKVETYLLGMSTKAATEFDFYDDLNERIGISRRPKVRFSAKRTLGLWSRGRFESSAFVR